MGLHLATPKVAPAPPEYIRFIFYERFHWTYADVAATPFSELMTQLTVMTIVDRHNNRPKPKRVDAA